MNWFTKVAEQSSFVYHGTTERNGKLIERTLLLQPLGDGSGNWSDGPFGGNPSNPALIYCATDKQIAMGYARDICRINNVQIGSVITAVPDWKAAVIDEDTVADIFETRQPEQDLLARKIWQAVLNVINENGGNITAQELRENKEDIFPESDSGYAQIMKDAAEFELPKLLSPDEFAQLAHHTVAFSKPLKVVKVEYFKI